MRAWRSPIESIAEEENNRVFTLKNGNVKVASRKKQVYVTASSWGDAKDPDEKSEGWLKKVFKSLW